MILACVLELATLRSNMAYFGRAVGQKVRPTASPSALYWMYADACHLQRPHSVREDFIAAVRSLSGPSPCGLSSTLARLSAAEPRRLATKTSAWRMQRRLGPPLARVRASARVALLAVWAGAVSRVLKKGNAFARLHNRSQWGHSSGRQPMSGFVWATLSDFRTARSPGELREGRMPNPFACEVEDAACHVEAKTLGRCMPRHCMSSRRRSRHFA